MSGPYLGDFDEGALIQMFWDTNSGVGASITRAVNGTISVYKNVDTTQSTAGVTDTEDFDGLTGIHAITIATSSDPTFYAGGNDFTIVLSGATIDGQSVNAVLGQFSINNRVGTYVGYVADVNVTQWNGAAVAVPSQSGVPEVDVTHWFGGAIPGVNATGVPEVDVTRWNGGVVQQASTGIPKISVKEWAGTDVATPDTAGYPVVTISGGVLVATIATGAITADAIAADAIGASELAADAVAEIQSGLATSANQATILNRLGAFTGSGFNTILGFFQALMRKDATTPSDLGGTYDDATDSLEAIRDRGDAAWITATGFSTLDAAGVRAAVGLASANLDTQLSTIDDYLDTEVSAIKAKTDQLNFTGTDVKATLDGETVTVSTNNDKTGYQLSATGIDDILRTALTEGYAADGAAPTLEQFMFMLLSALAEFSIAGTTITCKKLDGSTMAMEYTLDDGTNPTSRTRSA